MSLCPDCKEDFTCRVEGSGAGFSTLPSACVAVCPSVLTLLPNRCLSVRPHGWRPRHHLDLLPPSEQCPAQAAHVHREEEGDALCLVEWGQVFSDIFPKSDFFFHPRIWSKCFCFPGPFKTFFFLIKPHSYGQKGAWGSGIEQAQQMEMVIWGIPSCPLYLTLLKNSSALFKLINNQKKSIQSLGHKSSPRECGSLSAGDAALVCSETLFYPLPNAILCRSG